jgi:DNA polymerase-3 subunit gamma/tau
MLLKGYDETARAPNPRTAAEMVLIRLAYTADLPTPDDLIRTLGGESLSARRPAAFTSEQSASAGRAPINATTAAPTAETTQDDDSEGFDLEEGDSVEDGDTGAVDESSEAATLFSSPPKRELRSFEDVIALVGDKRDAKLKIHLEDHVSLVKFDGAAGSIDLFLLPNAPPELANDLREKLNPWTGRRWVVVLSKEAGARPIGAVRREREAAELESLKAHPAVRAVLEAFPDAKIAEIRRIAGRDNEAGDDDKNESETG